MQLWISTSLFPSSEVGINMKLSPFILLDSHISSNDKHYDSGVLPSNIGMVELNKKDKINANMVDWV
jgi:hypothetical protein